MKKKTQKEIFLEGEGDNYFKRNQPSNQKTSEQDFLLQEILLLEKLNPKTQCRVLEIGCGGGQRLAELKKVGYDVSGIDPSQRAVSAAVEKGINAKVGTADELPFENGSFDIVVFGFCLYVCDCDDLFKIAAEANRVLKAEGYVVIFDFFAEDQIINKYKHMEGVHSYKMNYGKLFDWHPNYTLTKQKIGSHTDFPAKTEDKNEQVAISILRKKS